MKMKPKAGHLFIAAIFFAGVILASGPGCRQKEDLVIGFIAGTTGRVADLGISGRDAVQMAIEQANTDGGINGRHIRLIIKNDEQDPGKAVMAARELIGSDAAAIIGPMTSDMAMAIVPALNKAGIPAVSPTATTQSLSGRDDFFFRVTSTTEEFATKNAAHHIKTGSMKRVSAVYDLNNRSFCENWLAIFKRVFNAGGGEIISTTGFNTSNDISFQDIALKLLKNKPDGILVIANSMDSALFCQQIRKIDRDMQITLADWGATERLLELGGKSVEGVTVIQTFNRNDTSPAYQAFRKTYMERFKREPGFPGVYAYDAAKVVLTALRDQRPGEELKQTILRLRRFKSLQNSIDFDAFGDVHRGNSSISVVRGRKFIVLD